MCQRPPRPASVAAAELACGLADLLALLPQWYPQAPKPELVEALNAAAAALERCASGAGGGGTAPPAESAATTRLLCKLLRALQVLLAEVSAAWEQVGAAGSHRSCYAGAGEAMCQRQSDQARASMTHVCVPPRLTPTAGKEGAWRQCRQPGSLPAAPLHLWVAAPRRRQRQQHAAAGYQQRQRSGVVCTSRSTSSSGSGERARSACLARQVPPAARPQQHPGAWQPRRRQRSTPAPGVIRQREQRRRGRRRRQRALPRQPRALWCSGLPAAAGQGRPQEPARQLDRAAAGVRRGRWPARHRRRPWRWRRRPCSGQPGAPAAARPSDACAPCCGCHGRHAAGGTSSARVSGGGRGTRPRAPAPQVCC